MRSSLCTNNTVVLGRGDASSPPCQQRKRGNQMEICFLLTVGESARQQCNKQCHRTSLTPNCFLRFCVRPSGSEAFGHPPRCVCVCFGCESRVGFFFVRKQEVHWQNASCSSECRRGWERKTLSSATISRSCWQQASPCEERRHDLNPWPHKTPPTWYSHVEHLHWAFIIMSMSMCGNKTGN